MSVPCAATARAASHSIFTIAKWDNINRSDYPKIKTIIFCDDPRNGTRHRLQMVSKMPNFAKPGLSGDDANANANANANAYMETHPDEALLAEHSDFNATYYIIANVKDLGARLK
jgi:hypothetical protein